MPSQIGPLRNLEGAERAGRRIMLIDFESNLNETSIRTLLVRLALTAGWQIRLVVRTTGIDQEVPRAIT